MHDCLWPRVLNINWYRWSHYLRWYQFQTTRVTKWNVTIRQEMQADGKCLPGTIYAWASYLIVLEVESPFSFLSIHVHCHYVSCSCWLCSEVGNKTSIVKSSFCCLVLETTHSIFKFMWLSYWPEWNQRGRQYSCKKKKTWLEHRWNICAPKYVYNTCINTCINTVYATCSVCVLASYRGSAYWGQHYMCVLGPWRYWLVASDAVHLVSLTLLEGGWRLPSIHNKLMSPAMHDSFLQ